MKVSPRSLTVLRWLLLAIAGLGTIAGLFVVVENWRGNRAWTALERELRAKGEKLEFAEYQPLPIADQQNFFKAPQLARLLYDRRDDPQRRQLLATTRLNEFRALEGFRRRSATLADLRAPLRRAGLLAAPDTASAAADVLSALAPLQPLLEDVRAAARERPLAALETRTTPFDPPQVAVDELFRLGQALGVHATATLELGRSDEAFADLFALQRLSNAIMSRPTTLLNVLVAIALQGLAAEPISDGLSRHAWSDPQLAAFQRQFSELRALAGFIDALRAERAAFLHVLDTRPDLELADFRWRWWLFHGWAQQNKVAYCRGLEAEVFALIDIERNRILAHRLPSPTPRQERRPAFAPYDFLARLALNNVGNLLAGLGSSAETLQLHAIACAIERHRLAHGRLPETLGELVPAHFAATPTGIFDGQPLRYEKRSDSSFRIHALGRNGQDDSGKGDDITLSFPDGL